MIEHQSTHKFHRMTQGQKDSTLESTEDPTQESTQNSDEAVEGRQIVMAPACTLGTPRHARQPKIVTPRHAQISQSVNDLTPSFPFL